jgi:hypothetical protein
MDASSTSIRLQKKNQKQISVTTKIRNFTKIVPVGAAFSLAGGGGGTGGGTGLTRLVGAFRNGFNNGPKMFAIYIYARSVGVPLFTWTA